MFLALRILFLIVVTVFVALGLAVAGGLLPLSVGLGLLAACGAVRARDEPWMARTWPGRTPFGLAAGAAGGTVIAVYAVIGSAVLLGGVITALLVAAVLAVYGGRRRWRNAGAARHGTEEDEHPTGTGVRDVRSTEEGTQRLLPPDPAALSTEEICRAWRVSYLLLERVKVPGELEQAADLRRRYLDELARRHPEGFRRWLDEGARAAGDPSRYIRQRSGSPGSDEG